MQSCGQGSARILACSYHFGLGFARGKLAERKEKERSFKFRVLAAVSDRGTFLHMKTGNVVDPRGSRSHDRIRCMEFSCWFHLLSASSCLRVLFQETRCVLACQVDG